MLNRVFEQMCRSAGSRTALVFKDDRYSFGQLEEQVAHWAAAMMRLDVTVDKGVALLLKNCPLFVIAYLASSRLGAPAFLLDPGSKPDELRRIFSESNVAVAVCEPGLQSILEQIREEANQRFVILVRDTGMKGEVNPKIEPPTPRIYDGEAAIIQYTSGTTGVPKCIVRSHRNLYCEAANLNETAGISADDRILCTIPLFHSHGFGNAFLAAMYAGATLVLMEEFNRAAAAEIILRERITVLPAVPLMFELLSQRGANGHRPDASLRLAFSAGARLPAKVARDFKDGFGVFVRQLYGTTEVGSAAINLDINPLETLDSVGPPLSNVQIKVLQENGDAAPHGESGELAIQSGAMTLGYLGQPELTSQRFRQGSFYPGDFGRMDNRGYLYLEGRSDWLILSSGKKVDLFEIEAVISTFAKVREVAVVGVPGYKGDKVLKAVVVLSEACREEEIIEYCGQRMSDFKVPRRVEFVNELPRNGIGKVLRKHLIS